MTPPACRDERRARLAGAAPSQHLAECAACRAFAARLLRVDASLGAASRAAESSPLAGPLRARILAAAAPTPARSAPRGRVVDLLLRAAAVAAVLVGAAWAVPTPVFASDEGLAAFAPPDLGLDRALAAQVEGLAALAETAPARLPDGPGPLAAAAAVFLAAGWAASRARRPA